MATRSVFGDATIDYEDEAGSPVTFTMGCKLIELQPADSQLRYLWEAADGIHDWRVEIGDAGVYELHASIRYDDDPAGLKAMLRRGMQGAVLTYKITSAGTEYPVKLMAVGGSTNPSRIPIERDRDRWRQGNYEARIHIKRVDGGSLDSMLNGANAL